MQDLRITLFQADPLWHQPEKNISNYSKQLSQLKGSTDLIILPEMAFTGFTMTPELFTEQQHSAVINWLKESAQQLNAAIVTSLPTFVDDQCFNRLYFITPEGESAIYDKRHLFRMGLEHKYYSAGKEQKIINYKGWRICFQVCYDLRFPVFSRNRNNYDLLLYIANWPTPRANAFNQLLAARAIENQCYVAAVNRVGSDDNGFSYQGDSQLISYTGEQLMLMPGSEVSINTSMIDYSSLQNYREQFPVWMDADEFIIK